MSFYFDNVNTFICSNVYTFGTCMLRVHESCEYDAERIDLIRKGLDFVNSVCDEDHPIFKGMPYEELNFANILLFSFKTEKYGKNT